MKTRTLFLIALVGCWLYPQLIKAQTTIVDDFNDGEWESTWVVQHNNVGATAVSEADDAVVMMNTGANQNGGIASIASFSPFSQGVRATFVLNELVDPDTGEFVSPAANGLFMGVVANNGAFYRAANNFGLAFFGQESRTASAEGFGFIARDLYSELQKGAKEDIGTLRIRAGRRCGSFNRPHHERLSAKCPTSHTDQFLVGTMRV